MTKNHDRAAHMHQLFKSGISLTEIGRTIGVSKQRVHQILKKIDDFQGIEDKCGNRDQAILDLAQAGKTRSEIAEISGVPYSTVVNLVQKKSIPVKKATYFADLSGHIFGKWTVVKALGYKQIDGTFDMSVQKIREFHWECRCECGRIRPIPRGNLVNGSTRSCLSCGAKQRRKKHNTTKK